MKHCATIRHWPTVTRSEQVGFSKCALTTRLKWRNCWIRQLTLRWSSRSDFFGHERKHSYAAMSFYPPSDPLDNRAEFITRHVGIEPQDERHMLRTIGVASRAALIEGVVPGSIARKAPVFLPEPVGEAQALAEL